MEENIKERELMSPEEFEQYLAENRYEGPLTFEATSKYKSIRRAIKRGHVLKNGMVCPKRPFNNRANTSSKKGVHSRANNELKKKIYEELSRQREN